MLIRIGYELIFDIPAPVSMVLMLYTHPERAQDLRLPDRLTLEPAGGRPAPTGEMYLLGKS